MGTAAKGGTLGGCPDMGTDQTQRSTPSDPADLPRAGGEPTEEPERVWSPLPASTGVTKLPPPTCAVVKPGKAGGTSTGRGCSSSQCGVKLGAFRAGLCSSASVPQARVPPSLHTPEQGREPADTELSPV